MPSQQQPRRGVSGNTLVLSARVPEALALAAFEQAGGREHFAEWLQGLLRQAVQGGRRPVGVETAAGYEEGKRQGWAHANKVFRKALGAAAEELKG